MRSPQYYLLFLFCALSGVVYPQGFPRSKIQKAEINSPLFQSLQVKKNTSKPPSEKIRIPPFNPLLTKIRLEERPLPLENLITEEQFDALFPIKNKIGASYPVNERPHFYSYQNFLAASQYFPYFLNEGNQDDRYRELAAFLAHISYEAGAHVKNGSKLNWWEYGLLWIEELPNKDGVINTYHAQNSQYPPVDGASYHGRGPIQLTWNYNYGALSEFLFGDKNILLNRPDLISQSGTLAFMSALWFWNQPQKPKPSAHDIMVGNVILEKIGDISYPLTGYQKQHNILSIGRDITGQTISYYNWQVPAGFSVGFGATISIVHGNREVGKHYITRNQAMRIAFYARYLDHFAKVILKRDAPISPQVSQGGDIIPQQSKLILDQWQSWRNFPLKEPRIDETIDFPLDMDNTISGKDMAPFK